jgi:FKBP-type peptidyl-prolyl cis-trans isomerase (trigger factor)
MINKKHKLSSKSESKSATSVIARSDDGTIQITLTIPFSDIKISRKEVVGELGKDIDVPGFRKGKAPLEKIIEKIPQNTLIEKTISKLLPKAFSDAIKEHKITPSVYPKFEVVKATDGDDWQVRAFTCELPEIDLGDYKKEIKGSSKTKVIWTPSSTKAKADKPDKEPTREEKEQDVLKILLEKVAIKIPKILTDEEVNSRLSKLLERIEKLGLTLESYLASLKKTAEQLREEYRSQAENSIKLDFILTKIAEKEDIKVTEPEISAAIAVSASTDPTLSEKLKNPDQKRLIETILKRRKVLDTLINL